MNTPYETDTITPLIVQQEQAEDEAFKALPRDPCDEGHRWEGCLGGAECYLCDAVIEWGEYGRP